MVELAVDPLPELPLLAEDDPEVEPLVLVAEAPLEPDVPVDAPELEPLVPLIPVAGARHRPWMQTRPDLHSRVDLHCWSGSTARMQPPRQSAARAVMRTRRSFMGREQLLQRTPPLYQTIWSREAAHDTRHGLPDSRGRQILLGLHLRSRRRHLFGQLEWHASAARAAARSLEPTAVETRRRNQRTIAACRTPSMFTVDAVASPGVCITVFEAMPGGGRRSRKLRTLADVGGVERPASILLVDGDPDVRLVLDEFLTAHGYEVCAVATCDDALNQLESRGPFAVVLIDLELRDRSGLEVLARLRDRREDAATAVVVIGATPQGEVEGVQAVLKKPVILGDLLATLEELLWQSGRPAPARPNKLADKTLEDIANGHDDALGTLRATVAKAYATDGQMEEAAYWYLCAAEHAERCGQKAIASSWRTLANLTAPAGSFGRLANRTPK